MDAIRKWTLQKNKEVTDDVQQLVQQTHSVSAFFHRLDLKVQKQVLAITTRNILLLQA